MMTEMIVCPSKLGNKTREECNGCQWCSLGDCPPGAYFVRNEEGDRKLFEDYLYDPTSIADENGRWKVVFNVSEITLEELKAKLEGMFGLTTCSREGLWIYDLDKQEEETQPNYDGVSAFVGIRRMVEERFSEHEITGEGDSKDWKLYADGDLVAHGSRESAAFSWTLIAKEVKQIYDLIKDKEVS